MPCDSSGSVAWPVCANGGANTPFVLALYREVLGRSPSASEEQSLVGQLNSGAVTPQQAAFEIVNSAEANSDLVRSWLLTWLGPGADLSAANFEGQALAAGATTQASLIGTILGGQTFLALLGQ